MKKMLLVGVVGLSALLGGCANTSELETSVQKWRSYAPFFFA